MYSVDDTVKALALAPARHIYSRAIFGTKSGNTWDNDRTYSDTDHIISAKISIGSGSGGLTIGGAYSAKLTLQLMGGVTVNQTDRIIMRVGFYKSDGTKSDPIGLGWFYVDSITRKDQVTTITAYDKMLRGAKIYKPTALTFPCRASAILDDICDKMGVSLRDGVAMPYDPIINSAPVKGTDNSGNTLYYTRREILGYIASIMGGNWFFDAGGHLAFTQFAAVGDTFAAENSTAADISPDAYAVTGITWNINGVPYSRFDDEDAAGMLEFVNPLDVDAKEPIIGAVEQRLIGLAYHGGTIQRQGCGWFELGDIVTAYRKDGTAAAVLITGINYSIENGAFTEKILSSALSESESNYTSGDITGQTVPQSVAQDDAVNSSGNISPLSGYEYLTDLSVKFNGTTYTVEKDSTTGLISKITDSYNHEFKPTLNSGIADVALHNAVFWAVAMHSGLGEVPEKVLFSGMDGSWEYSGGLTGFQNIKGDWQEYSGYSHRTYADGSVVARIEKARALSSSEDGYTDAVVVRSNEKINLTGYSKLRVYGMVFQNYDAGLTAKSYFCVGEPYPAQQNTAYDFSGWTLFETTKYYSVNYTNPGAFKWYDIDISAINGNQYLNFGVYHGTESFTNSCYLDIKKIMLIP